MVIGLHNLYAEFIHRYPVAHCDKCALKMEADISCHLTYGGRYFLFCDKANPTNKVVALPTVICATANTNMDLTFKGFLANQYQSIKI